ncbi:MAG: hypothetical protein ACQEP1_01975 [Nanobdellota archaeon]
MIPYDRRIVEHKLNIYRHPPEEKKRDHTTLGLMTLIIILLIL